LGTAALHLMGLDPPAERGTLLKGGVVVSENYAAAVTYLLF